MDAEGIVRLVREVGSSLVTKQGRLFVTPPGRLPADLRRLLEDDKQAVIGWLEAEADGKARAAALDAVMPTDFDSAAAGEDACTLLKLRDPATGAMEYLAVDPVHWDELTAWARSRKEEVVRKSGKKK